MSTLRLSAGLPAVYPITCAFLVVLATLTAVNGNWVAATLFALGAVIGVLIGVYVATCRFVVFGGDERSIELGSAYGRRRVLIASIALVRRRRLIALVPLRPSWWELIGTDGVRLARGYDEGLSDREVRAFETELRNLHLPVERR